jgi:hypothetical protein
LATKNTQLSGGFLPNSRLLDDHLLGKQALADNPTNRKSSNHLLPTSLGPEKNDLLRALKNPKMAMSRFLTRIEPVRLCREKDQQ